MPITVFERAMAPTTRQKKPSSCYSEEPTSTSTTHLSISQEPTIHARKALLLMRTQYLISTIIRFKILASMPLSFAKAERTYALQCS